MQRTTTGRSKAVVRVGQDEILREYDFSNSAPNEYASRYAAGSMVVVLEPDVAAALAGPAEVNETLWALAGIIQKHKARRTGPKRGRRVLFTPQSTCRRRGGAVGWRYCG